MIWIRSQFAKGLAEPSISTSQEYPGVWAISPFPQIDALHPLRYDLFLFFSSQSCATWSLWCVTKRTRLWKFWGSSGTGTNGQEGKSLQVQQALVRAQPWLLQVSQCILFTAASADHEAELLEV